MESYYSLRQLYKDGVITNLASEDQIQGSSIDVRLGSTVMREMPGDHIIVLRNRDAMVMEPVLITHLPYALKPGEFILAHTEEMFFMPNDYSATFHLKSTSARSALGHLLAVHIDPGFNNSTLTLEIHNVSRYHTVLLHHLDMIGQIIFWHHRAVPEKLSYKRRGHYNNDRIVSGVKP